MRFDISCAYTSQVNHGRFEDPYKLKVSAWLSGPSLYVKSASDAAAAPEVFNLAHWKVSPESECLFGFVGLFGIFPYCMSDQSILVCNALHTHVILLPKLATHALSPAFLFRQICAN